MQDLGEFYLPEMEFDAIFNADPPAIIEIKFRRLS